MKNIVLIGMPGSGKTTFGRALSRELNRPFVDADDYLEEREGRTISSFFAESEKAFRDAEERTIRELADRQGIVISTGGGVVKRTANVENLRRNGRILLIDRPVDDIVNDVEVETRPLLKDGPQKVFDLYRERRKAYRNSADIIIDNRGNPEEVLRQMLDAIHQAPKSRYSVKAKDGSSCITGRPPFLHMVGRL